MENCGRIHYVKSVLIWIFSDPYFPAFGLNTERYRVSLRISPNAEKVDQKNSEYGHFSRIELRLRLGWRYTLKLLTTLPVKQNAMLTWGLVNTCHLTYQWLQKIRVHHEKNLQLKITFFVANLQGNYMIFQFFVAKPINLVF